MLVSGFFHFSFSFHKHHKQAGNKCDCGNIVGEIHPFSVRKHLGNTSVIFEQSCVTGTLPETIYSIQRSTNTFK